MTSHVNRCLCTALAALLCAAAPAAGDVVDSIAADVKGREGLALDIGCGDASLAIAVARRTTLFVQCVDPDAAAVAKARKAIEAAGVYGTRAAADVGPIDRLRYPDGSANLVICGDGLAGGRRGRDLKEVLRVLNPNGAAWIGPLADRRGAEAWLAEAGVTSFRLVEEGGAWVRLTKPRDAGWDEWTHRSHDPSGVHASGDTLNAADMKLSWSNAPRPGLGSAAMLVAGGRLIEVARGYDLLPDLTPYIQVSDAFNGVVQWVKAGKALGIDRPLLHYSPIRACSDVAAVDGRLYVLGAKLCHVLDLADGAELRRIAVPPEAGAGDGDIWLYLSCPADALVGAAGPSPRHYLRGFSSWGGPHWRGFAGGVFALDRKTDKVRWVRREPVHTASICVAGEGPAAKVVYITKDRTLRAIELATGKEVLSAKVELAAEPTTRPAGARAPRRGARRPAFPPGMKITNAAAYRGKLWVMYTPSGDVTSKARDAGWQVAVFSLADGRLLARPRLKEAVSSMTFSAGEVFMAPQHAAGQIYRFSADTCEVTAALLRGRSGSKCTPLLATPNWLLYRHQAGSGFVRIDRKTDRRYTYHRIRCTCHYPGLPANGLLYVQGPGCNCAHRVRANVALTPGKRLRRLGTSDDERLVKGPAYDHKPRPAAPAGWASWRGDARRSGRTAQQPAMPLAPAWTKRLPGKLTPAAVADGLVFVGSTARKLFALDAATGRVRWARTVGGRVAVAPFCWGGRVYFGDDDGWAHCLRAADGEVVWRFHAALGLERVVAYERYMSAWPVGSGVLVNDGTAYFTAGYFPQEGGRLYAVDATTGEVKWTRERETMRREFDSVQGPMAMGDTVLYMPTIGGTPMGVHLDDADHRAHHRRAWGGAFSARGQQLMTLGDDVLAASNTMMYVHHVACVYDLRRTLPVLDDKAVYLRDGRRLTADRRQAYRPHKKSGLLTWAGNSPLKKVQVSPEPADVLWSAWKGVTMTAAIQAGDVVFTGSAGKVHATAAADGKELWSAPVTGAVTDLAFDGGRLVVVTDAGEVVCFAPGSLK